MEAGVTRTVGPDGENKCRYLNLLTGDKTNIPRIDSPVDINLTLCSW